MKQIIITIKKGSIPVIEQQGFKDQETAENYLPYMAGILEIKKSLPKHRIQKK